MPVLGGAYLLATLAVWWLAGAEGSTQVLAMTVLAGAGVMGAQFCITAVVTTFYPTEIRSTGVGTALGFGRLGSLTGPLIGGLALGAGVPPTQIFALLALPMLICFIAALLFSGALKQRRAIEQAEAA